MDTSRITVGALQEALAWYNVLTDPTEPRTYDTWSR